MENKFGKVSRLCLTASKKGGKTILSELSFTAPFKVMHPFYDRKNKMSVMLLTASAGIMAGDRQEFEIRLEEGADMAFVSQAYDKIHRMEQGYASRSASLYIGKNARLEYTPLPTIPFAGSDYRSELNVHLEDATSQFVFTEVLTCGRIAHGEKFGYRKYRNDIRVQQGEKLLYRDHTCYEPGQMDMEGFGMYEGYTHLGTLLFINIPKEEQWIEAARQRIDDTPDMEGGVTRTAGGHPVVRILGRNADRLVKLLNMLKDETEQIHETEQML